MTQLTHLPPQLEVGVEAAHGEEADVAAREGLAALGAARQQGLLPRQPGLARTALVVGCLCIGWFVSSALTN